MARHPTSPRARNVSLMAAAVVLVAVVLFQEVQPASACPFAGTKGMMQAMPHLRKILNDNKGSGPKPNPNSLPPPACKESSLETFSTCDELAGYGSYSPRFYEKKGCKGGPGLWGTIVNAMQTFDHPKYGKSFVDDCLAPMIRNVFHMDIGLGHNARLFLEDWGKKGSPYSKPDANPSTSRTAKLAVPNLTLRCFDIYEHLRVEVDKYTDKYCPEVYVSCTDLSNYAARYAHWKLSDGKFLPCYNYGFADTEPEDFAGDAWHKNLSPRLGAQSCMPPHDSGDMFPEQIPREVALSKKNFKPFFDAAMKTFSEPCYPTPQHMDDKDLASILLGHSVGQAHCFLIQLLVKEPFQDNKFFKKLADDCTKCRAAVAANKPDTIAPYGNFKQNLKSDKHSFAQQCKSAGMVDYLPQDKATEVGRMNEFIADPCCVPNDVFTKDLFDFQYFPQVVNGYGLFEVDNGLAVHPTTKELTEEYAQCSNSHKMFEDYQRAWNKMNLIGATPYDGKRRKYCSIPSWATAEV